MTPAEIVARLTQLGSENTARVLRRHGAHDPCLGVKIGDMKPLQKQIGTNYALSLQLYDSGIYDAMYLAGLIAEPDRMAKKDLTRWVKTASKPIASYVVGPIAAGSPDGWTHALAWINSKKEIENIAGWVTLSAIASIRPDVELDLDEYQRLLDEVECTIHTAKDAVRYQMNSFVISGEAISLLSLMPQSKPVCESASCMSTWVIPTVRCHSLLITSRKSKPEDESERNATRLCVEV